MTEYANSMGISVIPLGILMLVTQRLFFRGGVLAVDVSYLTYSLVLLVFIFWKKLYKDTWYGR